MDETKAQDHVLALLADPATHGGLNPSRVDTHISSVFLVGDYAWKLKRAVKLPFLDFSTPDLRRAACEAEIAANTPWNPALYLGVVPVTLGADGKLRLGGQGETVDWVVSMRRFAPNAQLDQLVAQGEIERPLLNGLARTLWRGYQSADVRPDRGGAAGMLGVIEGLRLSFAPFYNKAVPQPQVEEIIQSWRELVGHYAQLLDYRRDNGSVRRCHGDLHLGNVCLFDGALAPFDAIEFSEDFSVIDVLYDLAFLVMDLAAHDVRDYASMVLNSYLDLSGDFDGMPLLPLFLSMRAGVRSMVKASMGQAGEARRYLDLAHDCLTPPEARIVAVGGLSGSGKSRMARRLAPLLAMPGAPVVRTDALRKRLMGVDLTEALAPEGYVPEVTAKVYETLVETCARLAAWGMPVIADGVFARPEERAAIEAAALKAGCPFNGLWLEASFDVAAARIERRSGDASDATPDVRARQQDLEIGSVTWTWVATDRANDGAFKKVKMALGIKR